MKLAVSNIAWQPDEETQVAAVLPQRGVDGIELAPSKRWPDFMTVTAAQVADYRAFWNDRGLPVVAIQSVLFGHPELTVFGDGATRERTAAYLERSIWLAAGLGARIIVFGSPKNRQRGPMSTIEADDIAVGFFHRIGAMAAEQGVTLCIEPNAPAYGCDFITTAAAGRELVARVASPGFGLHLDAACMAMVGDEPEEIVASKPAHFHASSPGLAAVPDAHVPHSAYAATLAKAHYDDYVSIEMKAEAAGNLARVETAVNYVRAVFAA